MDRNERITLWRRLLSLVAPHKGRFILATLSLIIGSVLGLAYPQAARYAVDVGLQNRSVESLNQVALALVAVFMVHAVFTWVRHYLMSWLGERAVADLRSLVYQRLLHLDPGWFHERRTGELVGRLAADVATIQNIVGSEMSIALRELITLIGGIIFLFVENAKLTLVMLSVVPPLVLLVLAFGKRIRSMSESVQEKLGDASAEVQEAIAAIETVQAFSREGYEVGRYQNSVNAVFQESLRLAKWRGLFIAGVTMAGSLAISGIIWVGGREVVEGNLSVGDLAAFMLYTLMISVALGSIAGLWSSLQQAAGATKRLFEIIDQESMLADPVHPQNMNNVAGRIAFQHAHFTYPARLDAEVLHDIDFVANPGEVVALVGRSGAGKTTITALLQRFYDVSQGSISLDSIDIRQMTKETLRQQLAIVAQEPVLFSGSIRDNIAYGKRDASDDEIIAAAKDANADAFIRSFPDGYQTLVGERGVKLSGGQKQRIAIARALLKNPRVLILDEATSNLDAESESLVQDALQKLMRGRTTLVIAHRLSTVRSADRILVMDKGRIVESGNHDVLMQQQGLYRRLVEHQLIFATDGLGLEAATAAH